MQEQSQTLELTIIDVSRSGPGVARDSDGRVVFVPGTAPGDRVLARVVKIEKRFVEAEVVKIIESSPGRVQPRCSVFGRCGGCQWQHLPYELQWKTKISGALHALKRVGLQDVERLAREEYPSHENPWSYRNRLQLRGGAFGLGFYSRGSHDIVPITRCEIAREELNRVLPDFRNEALTKSSPSKLEIEVRESGEVSSIWNASHGAMGFRQINDSQNRLLQEWIARRVQGGKVLMDLYGGSGNLSVGIASRFERIHCVDSGAGRLREVTGSRSVPSNVEFHAQDVKAWAKQQLSLGSPGLGGACILDPPREGCGDALPSIASLLEAFGINELIAVGCDPDSWARDISRFSGKGWRVDSLAFFDFFPQTTHFESVARLVKRV